MAAPLPVFEEHPQDRPGQSAQATPIPSADEIAEVCHARRAVSSPELARFLAYVEEWIGRLHRGELPPGIEVAASGAESRTHAEVRQLAATLRFVHRRLAEISRRPTWVPDLSPDDRRLCAWLARQRVQVRTLAARFERRVASRDEAS